MTAGSSGAGRAGTLVTETLPERPAAPDDALARAAAAYLRRAEQLGYRPGGGRSGPSARPERSFPRGTLAPILLERMFDEDELNPEQRTAATHGEGPLLIVAGRDGQDDDARRPRGLARRRTRVAPERVLSSSRTAAGRERAPHPRAADDRPRGRRPRMGRGRSTRSRIASCGSTAARSASPLPSPSSTRPTGQT
jgi:hypothetical protein